jgi:hypothetical protein
MLRGKLSRVPSLAVAADVNFFLVPIRPSQGRGTTMNDCRDSVTWVAAKQQHLALAELNFFSQ